MNPALGQRAPAADKSPPPQPTVAAPRRRALTRRFGLLTAGIITLAIGGGVALCLYAQDQALRNQQQEWGFDVSRAFARLVGDAPEIAPVAEPWCVALHAAGALQSVSVQDPAGKPLFQWPAGGTAAPASAAAPSDLSGSREPIQFIANIRKADGSSRGRAVLLMRLPAARQRPWMALLGSVGILGGALGAYAFLHRRVGRQLRPAIAVETGLSAYAQGLEQNLHALALSDGLGQVASAWNKLLQELAQLRAQGGKRSSGSVGEAAMQKLENRALRSVLDRLPIGVLQYGADGVIHYANAIAASLLNALPEKLPGAPLSDATGSQTAATLMDTPPATGRTVEQSHGEGDSEVVLRYQLAPRGGDADIDRLLTIQDVSHMREADRSRDKFLYHVTHELRTPLTNIQAYAETLTKPDFDDEQTRRECYNVIISETRRLSRLVEDILSVSQLEVGSARIEMGPVDLVRLLRQIVQDHLGHADEKRIDLRLNLPPKAPRVNGDKERLTVLITNLVGNAVKYTPEGGQVVVELDTLDEQACIRVKDNGIGIAPNDQAHVFDKFYRASTDEVLAQTGTGLGLAIAREIARAHGGDIRVESALGAGSTFMLELPIAVAPAERGGAS